MGVGRTWRRLGAIGVVAVALAATACEPAPDTFTPTSDMVVARVDHTATLLQSGRVLAVGGAGAGQPSVEAYDPATGNWSVRPGLTFNRSGHVATRLSSGDVLVTGGLTAQGGPEFSERYIVGENRWEVKDRAPRPGPHATALLPDGKVLAVFESDPRTGWLYDPREDEWQRTLGTKTTASWKTVTLLPGGKVLAVGGDTVGSTETSSGFTRAERYDPSTGRWTVTNSAPSMNVGLTTLNNGRVLAVGSGILSPEASTYAEIPLAVATYSPQTGAWTRSEDASGCNNFGTRDLTLTGLADGSALVLGRAQCVSSTYSLAVRLRSGFTSSLRASERGGHTASLLNDGRVLVAGGEFGHEGEDSCCIPGPPSRRAELFNP